MLTSLLTWLLDVLVGCTHDRTTWPQTPINSRTRRPVGPTYVACLNCGREIPYDWDGLGKVPEPAAYLEVSCE